MKQYFSVLKGDRVFCSAHKIVSVFSGLKLTLPNQMSRKKSPFLCPATQKGKFLCMDPSCVIAILQVLILPFPVVFSPPPPPLTWVSPFKQCVRTVVINFKVHFLRVFVSEKNPDNNLTSLLFPSIKTKILLCFFSELDNSCK